MMKILVILSATAAALCFMIESAKAQPAPRPQPMYTTLRQLFEEGALPEDVDLIGWRTGRCYHWDQPWTPWNGLLTGWTTPGPDHGPMKPTPEILRTLPVYWVNGGPAIFDQMTPQLEDMVTQFISSQAPMVAPARYDANSVYGAYVNRYDQAWVLRKIPAASFRLANALLEDQGPVDRGGRQGGPPQPAPGPQPLPQNPNGDDDKGKQDDPGQQPIPSDFYIVGQMSRNGQVIQYCYFFKEVHADSEQPSDSRPLPPTTKDGKQ